MENVEITHSIGNIEPIDIEKEMRTAYLDYAMSVIVSRALPDARDGLKPVHRRILYAMYDMGNRPGTPYRKSARIVGEVLGKYHPHSDSAVYDAMARMAQDFSMRYLLVDGQGNFGSIDGDNPAAMRYTEARMTPMSGELLLDIDKDTVDWYENFDNSLQQPTVLPARIPNMLLNGSNGIAVGMATNIPPHNLTELCDASMYLIDHFDDMDNVTVEDLMQFVKGPDFPTGAKVLGGEELVQAYATGRGTITMRAVAEIEEMKNNRHRIVFTEIPYQVNKANLIIRIAELVRGGRLSDISDLRDETDRNGISIVVELKRGAQPNRVLNQLYKYTALQSNFGMNVLALLDGETRTMPLKTALRVFIEHRQDVITRRTQYELDKAKQRAHILEGLRIALDRVDEIIQTIRQSDSVEDARAQLVATFGLSEAQAQAILDMQLRRLAALERQKIEDEYKAVMETIAYLEELLANPDKVLSLIKEDLVDIKEKYGDERRTEIVLGGIGSIEEADMIKSEEVLVTITRQGYVKRVTSDTYKSQGRGGRGVTGMTTRDEDDVVFLFAANTHDTILYFSDKGKVYSEKTWRIPDTSRTARGIAIVNLINILPEEKITAVIAVSSFEEAKYLTMVTKGGRMKRTELSDFKSVRPSGLIALTLEEDDTLYWVKITQGNNDIILVTKLGRALRFKETDARVMGRTAMGVNAIKLAKGDELAGMALASSENNGDLLVITSKGMGKRTPLSEYATRSRYGAGITTLAKALDLTGPIVEARAVEGTEDITLISSEGKMMRTQVEHIPRLGRVTRGAKVMNLRDEDTVASIAIIDAVLEDEEEAETEAEEPTQA
ncbi:MAG: DNA gyrase subunit A [Chloroflexota bacterium]